MPALVCSKQECCSTGNLILKFATRLRLWKWSRLCSILFCIFFMGICWPTFAVKVNLKYLSKLSIKVFDVFRVWLEYIGNLNEIYWLVFRVFVYSNPEGIEIPYGRLFRYMPNVIGYRYLSQQYNGLLVYWNIGKPTSCITG